MPDDNYRNPSREAKHQRFLLRDYFSLVEALAFQDYPIIPRTVIYAGAAQISNTFSKKIESISNMLQNYFKPNHKSLRLLKNFNPSNVTMSPIEINFFFKMFFFSDKFARYF